MKQIRLCGSGGQGVITAAIILAESAILEGNEVVQSQSYGPEAREGDTKADVIISRESISYPKATKPDIVLALTQQAADKYSLDLLGEGILIIDEDLVTKVPNHPNIVKAPLVRLTIKELGENIFTSSVALGFLVKLTEVVELETIKNAVGMRVPSTTIEKNMRALQLGYDLSVKLRYIKYIKKDA